MDQQATSALPAPTPEPTPERVAHKVSGRWAQAALAAMYINLRCLAIVTALAVIFLIVSAVPNMDSFAAGTYYLMFAWAVHVAAIIIVGYPLGVLTSRLLAADTSQVAATITFTIIGGVSGALLTVALGVEAQLIWCALGAATAGGARAWAHRTVRTQNSSVPDAPEPV